MFSSHGEAVQTHKWYEKFVDEIIKDDAFKDVFPAYRKKCQCLTDKRTHFQCQLEMIMVVFGEKIEDYLFNFEGKYHD